MHTFRNLYFKTSDDSENNLISNDPIQFKSIDCDLGMTSMQTMDPPINTDGPGDQRCLPESAIAAQTSVIRVFNLARLVMSL